MKKSKPSTGKAKRPQQMTKEELIATLLKKKQCNAKALLIVEGMLENEVNPQWLLNSLQFITQSHYQDAVEERSIVKICGYPLCKNPLVNVPKQQFRISTQNNKVYDISDRKNFCSNACYRSSTFLKDQIMTSPLWVRDIEKIPVYKLLEGSSTRDGTGDEIDLGPTRVTAQEASIHSSVSDESGEKSQIEDNEKNYPKVEESAPYVSIEMESSENSALLTQNECGIPTREGMIASVSFGDQQRDSTSNETVPKKELKQEVKLPESRLTGSVRSEGTAAVDLPQIEVKPDDEGNKDKPEPTKIASNLKRSELPEELARGAEENKLKICAGSTADRRELKSDVEKNTGESILRNAAEKGKIAEENCIRNTVGEEKSSAESGVRNAVEKEKNAVEKERNGEGCAVTSAMRREESSENMGIRSTAEDEKSAKDRKQGCSKTAVRKQKRLSRHASSKAPCIAVPSVSQLVEERLTEWFTVDSLCFLYGEHRTREMLGQLGGDFEQNFKPLDSATWDPEKHDRFVNICKRLNLLDLEDRSYDEKVINEDKNVVKRPLPDFNKLKEEAEKMDLRVQAFYKGQLELEPRKVTFAEDTKEEGEERELPVIPLVHQHEQRALRRRLVLESLNRVLPDLLTTIGVHSSQVNSALRGLVGTFALTASNVTFNPRQWTLAAIAIIKLLSVRDARLHLALTSQASQKYFTLIQMSYNLGPTYLDLLMDRLVSSAIVPPKQNESN